MHRRLFVALIATITFSIVFLNGNLNVAAKSVQDYETEIKELDEKKNKVENKKNKITSDKKSIKGKKDKNTDEQEVVNNDLKRSEEHTSELQSRFDLVCRLLLEKKKK